MVRCFTAWLRLLLRGGGVDALPGRSTGAAAAGRTSSNSPTCWPACSPVPLSELLKSKAGFALCFYALPVATSRKFDNAHQGWLNFDCWTKSIQHQSHIMQ